MCVCVWGGGKPACICVCLCLPNQQKMICLTQYLQFTTAVKTDPLQ